MAIHIPLIFAVDVGHHLRVVTHHFEQIGGNITVEVMGKDLFSLAVVHTRAVGGDHVGFDAEIVANLADIDVMSSGGEDKIDPARGQQLQRLSLRRALSSDREKAACHLSQTQQPGT